MDTKELKPEAKARNIINRQLENVGWKIVKRDEYVYDVNDPAPQATLSDYLVDTINSIYGT